MSVSIVVEDDRIFRTRHRDLAGIFSNVSGPQRIFKYVGTATRYGLTLIFFLSPPSWRTP